MAVEAHHLHLLPSQLPKNRYQPPQIPYLSSPSSSPSPIPPSAAPPPCRDPMNPTDNQPGAAAAQMHLSGNVPGNGSFLHFYNPSAATADSGVTYNNNSVYASAAAAASRKRARESDVPSLLQQQMQEVDRLVAHHAEKMRAGLAERRGAYWRAAAAAVEEGVARRLREKEEEMERVAKLNWALEERVKSLCVENQIWRDLAQTNEAAANVLRSNLEQVLAAQARQGDGGCAAAADDAESCCCGENDDAAAGSVDAAARRMCRSCGEREPSVLLLPCRHLCLCSACGPAINACPVCKCSKDGSVNVNIV